MSKKGDSPLPLTPNLFDIPQPLAGVLANILVGIRINALLRQLEFTLGGVYLMLLQRDNTLKKTSDGYFA